MRCARLGRWLPAAVTVLLVGGLPGAAFADSWSAGDRAHDVESYAVSSQPEPCGSIVHLDGSGNRTVDLRRLTVAHSSTEVVLTAELDRYRHSAHVLTMFHLQTPTGRLEVDVYSQRGRQAPTTVLAEEPRYAKPTGPCDNVATVSPVLPCDAMHATIAPAENTISVTIPRSCLEKPTWVRAGVQVLSFRGSKTMSDEWGHRPSHQVHYLVPEYGPRVRADRAGASRR